MTATVIPFPMLNHPDATCRPVYDHGHFLNSDGRCVLCEVRTLAEVRNQRLMDAMGNWFDSEIGS